MENIDFDKEINKINKTTTEIFDLIKKQDWKKLNNLLLSNKIDYNIKDISKTYLLEYAIIFNQEETIKILLNYDVKIDIIDDSKRSILYNIIKFSYIPILILLLEKNKNSIGQNILEIKDDIGNIALFYAIQFFNLDCIKIILRYTDNYYLKNKDGDNGLHLAIKSQNIEIYKILSNYIKDLKSRNNNGETYLHLIIKYKCYDMLNDLILNHNKSDIFNEILNYTEFKYNFTILHYVCINLDYNILSILEKFKLINKLNGNIQDNTGNIFYHYFINNIINIKKISLEDIKNINNINNILIKIDFNYNLYNIDGNTVGHIFFSNVSFFRNNNLNNFINLIVEKINMNIQNFKGESIFYLIIKNNIWNDIKNILVMKKLDIFILIEKNNTIFDYIEDTELDNFIDLITNSYLFQLSNSDSTTKWLDYWDNRCKKNIHLNELNETEIEILKTYNIKNNKNICYNIIFNKIKTSIKLFIESKNIYEFESYPVSNKFIKLIKNYPIVYISSFSGTTLDVLCGLIYLNNKFNLNKKNYIASSINLINLSKPLINCNIIDNNLDHKICEISGFEILWKNNLLIIPSSSQNNINKQLNYLHKNKNCSFYIIPIGIEMNIKNVNYSHANYLIFDFNLMEVERFEPHGSDHPTDLDYNQILLDSTINDKINELEIKFKYINPFEYLPKIGFQIKEINELKNDYIGDPNGFCALWCIWWADLRLTNPDIPRKKLFKLLNKELINGKYSYKKLIRDYSFYITNLRDNILLKANSNINEWLNDTINDKNLENLNNYLIEEINNLL